MKETVELCSNCSSERTNGVVCSECHSVIGYVDAEYDPAAPYGRRRPDFELIQTRLNVLFQKALPSVGQFPRADISTETRSAILQMVDSDPELTTRVERGLVLEAILDELFGFGPVGRLRRDERVSSIYCVGTGPLFVRCGKGVERTTLSFQNEKHFATVFDGLTRNIRGELNADSPFGEGPCFDDWIIKVAIPPRVKQPVFAIHRLKKERRIEGSGALE